MIKVADFGLTENTYATMYYRQEKSKGGAEERLPIRWMAPESIENNIYDEKTDVVSTCSMCMKRCMHLLNYYSSLVGVWSDLLGDFYLRESSILWHSSNASTDCAEEWREAGEAKQCCMLL